MALKNGNVHNLAITPKAQQWKRLNVMVFFYFWMLLYCKHSSWERNFKAVAMYSICICQGIDDYHMYSLVVDAFFTCNMWKNTSSFFV